MDPDNREPRNEMDASISNMDEHADGVVGVGAEEAAAHAELVADASFLADASVAATGAPGGPETEPENYSANEMAEGVAAAETVATEDSDSTAAGSSSSGGPVKPFSSPLVENELAEEPPITDPPWSLPGAATPEVNANFLSILSVWWLTPLMLLGHKRPLRHKDIYPLMERYTAGSIYSRFDANWQKELVKRPVPRTEPMPEPPPKPKKGEPKPPPGPPGPSLLKAIYATFGRLFMTAGIFRLLGDACTLASPVVLRFLLEVIAGGGLVPGRGKSFGYAMSGVLFFLQLLATLCSNSYLNRAVRTGFSVRTSLISAIYGKTLVLSQAARSEFTAGKTVNLMSVDASRLDAAAWQLHSLWAAPITVLVAMGLLIAQLGPSALVGMTLLLLLLPLQAILMRHLMQLRRQTNALTDKRVRMTQETVAGIRVVKLLGWESAMEKHLGQVRTDELVNVRTIGNWRAYMTGVTFTSPILASVLTFVVYALTGNDLNPPVVFSSIALFNALRMPLMMLPLVITGATDAWVSLQRIQALLLAPELGGDTLGKPDVPGKVVVKAGEYIWEAPVKLLPDPPKRRGGPPAMAGGGTMRRGAYSGTTVLPGASQEASGFSGWMQRTFKGASSTRAASSGTSSATEMAAKRAVRAADVPSPNGLNSPSPEGAPFTGLHDISLSVAPGELLAIVGRVGSGKSSLLSALVGEMKRTSGTGGIGGTVSFCPQSPWIQNATVRDNVLFGLPYDEAKYWDAVRVAALERDLEILPDGDFTEIGERGITLSGGQKARVSLARAVYANADCVLLDDPLSAVDANVGRHIFEKCIAGALMRKTRILVTHQIHVLPACDRIICLDSGKIVQQGTYAELMVDREGYLNKIMTEYGGATNAEDEPDGDASVVAKEGGNPDSDKVKIARKASTRVDLGATITPQAGKALMTNEERNAGSVRMRVYWEWITFAGGAWFLFWVLFFLLATQGTKVGTDTWLAQWSVDAYGLSLATYMGVYCLFGFLQGFCAVAIGLLLSFQGRLASKRMHEAALGHVLHAPSSFFDQTPVGRIMNRFSKDVDSADNTLPETWRMFLMTFSTSVSTLILISVIQPIFIAVMVPLMVVYYFAQAFYRATARELKRLDSISRSPLFANFGETLTGLSTIRAFRAESRFAAKNELQLDNNNRCYYQTLMIPRWLSIRLETISACLVFTTATLAVGTASPSAATGLLSLAVTYSLQLTGVMNWLVRQASETEVQMNGVERLLFYAEELEQEAPPVIPENRPASSWPSKGEIDLNALEVRYRPDLPPVLCGISVHVNAGERVGIVGRTGAGKSTIMTSLFRLVEASSGSIVIDGVDIAKIGLHDLRSKLSIIPQDPILFSGTVRYNLDPFNEFSDADVWDCLGRAGDLGSTISALPDKLEAPVAEGGENFSVGQRSLMCLARAMLRKSQIVVLDEATASVDLRTDELIQTTIRTDERFKGRTILTIAHRLFTVMDYDRILVLDAGRVVQFDTPANLVSQPGPLRSLVDETGPVNAEVLVKVAQRGSGSQVFGRGDGLALVEAAVSVGKDVGIGKKVGDKV